MCKPFARDYGWNSESIQRILDFSSTIDLFARNREFDETKIANLVEAFLARAGQVVTTCRCAGASLRLKVLRGCFRELHRGIYGIEPYIPWGECWDEWSRGCIGSLAAYTSNMIVKEPELKRLIKPPLWPVEGLPNVVNDQAIPAFSMVHNHKVLSECFGPGEDQRDRAVAYEMLATSASLIWNAIRFEIVRNKYPVLDNPFLDLVHMLRDGAFPLGCSGQEFCVFVFSPNPLEEVQTT